MRSEWLVSLIAVLIVIAGLALGAHFFHQKSHAKRLKQQISLIESLKAENRNDEALTQIEAVSPQVRDGDTRRYLERQAIQVLMRMDKTDEARRRAEAYLEANAEDPNLGAVHYTLGKVALEQEKNVGKAARHFEQVARSHSSDPCYPAALLGLAAVDVQQDEIFSAKKRLDELIEMSLDSDLRDKVENLLGQVNSQLLFSRHQMEGDQIHEVKSGETPIGIARRFGIETDLLMRCNNIANPQALRAGRRLKIPKVSFSLLVNLSDNTLTLLNDGKFFKKYRIRTGRFNGLTPQGQFTVQEKLKNPRWSDPVTGQEYPPNDPKNELGTRWLRFDRGGLGIHGTIHPESIGQYASRGCIGMLKEDVEELYDLIPVKTKVTIIGERKERDYSEVEKKSAVQDSQTSATQR